MNFVYTQMIILANYLHLEVIPHLEEWVIVPVLVLSVVWMVLLLGELIWDISSRRSLRNPTSER